jgi:hypothetical protein
MHACMYVYIHLCISMCAIYASIYALYIRTCALYYASTHALCVSIHALYVHLLLYPCAQYLQSRVHTYIVHGCIHLYSYNVCLRTICTYTCTIHTVYALYKCTYPCTIHTIHTLYKCTYTRTIHTTHTLYTM